MKARFRRAWGYQGNNLALPVADVEDASRFYLEMMDFQILSRSALPCESVILGRDEVQIGLAENGGDPTQDGCAFEVEDIEAIFADFNAKGLKLSELKIEERQDGSWKVFFLIAPDGLCYQLSERQSTEADVCATVNENTPLK